MSRFMCVQGCTQEMDGIAAKLVRCGIASEAASEKMATEDGMFKYAYYFNQDLSAWNVSKVTNMNGMFMQARREGMQKPLPLEPNLLHYITFLFRIHFSDYVIIAYITELVSNYLSGYLISCVVAKHTMWTSDCIT